MLRNTFVLVLALAFVLVPAVLFAADDAPNPKPNGHKEVPAATESDIQTTSIVLKFETGCPKPIENPSFLLKGGAGFYSDGEEVAGVGIFLEAGKTFFLGGKDYKSESREEAGGFKIDPGLAGILYMDRAKVIFANTDVSLFAPIGWRSRDRRGASSTFDIAFLPVGGTYNYDSKADLQFVGARVGGVGKLNLHSSVNGILDIGFGFQFIALEFGKGEMFGKEFNVIFNPFQAFLGVGMDFKGVMLRATASYSFDAVSGHHPSLKKEDQGNDAFFLNQFLSGRLEIERIGGSPIAIFYLYTFQSLSAEGWAKGLSNEQMFHYHLVGISARYF